MMGRAMSGEDDFAYASIQMLLGNELIDSARRIFNTFLSLQFEQSSYVVSARALRQEGRRASASNYAFTARYLYYM